MVIKTEGCAFTEFRIYPGHGIRLARRDGQVVILINSKAKSLYLQRIKPAKLTWTQAWRRMNKKGKVEEVHRRKNRRTVKSQKAIVGASVDEIKSRRNQKPEARAAAREAALKEIKAAKKAQAAARSKVDSKATKSVQKNLPQRGQKKTGNRGKL